MGIKELTKFIEPCGVLVSYDEYGNQYIAVDAFQKIYKYCVVRGDDLQQGEKAIFNKHLRAIMNCINQLIKFKIIPIFVFDGSSITSKIKNKIINGQNKKTTDIINTPNTNSDIKQDNTCVKSEQIKKIFKISPQQIKECEILISHIGIPYVRAPFEADSQCAAMTMKTCSANIKTVITDDTDALVFGSRSILRMLPMTMVDSIRMLFSNFVKSSPDPKCEYSISDILEKNRNTNDTTKNMINCNDYVHKLQNKLNIDIKYKYETIVKFSDMSMINFAIRYDIGDVLLFLKARANTILSKNNKTTIDEFTRENFIDMCILFGTDYLPRIASICVNEVFKHYVLSDFDIVKFVDTLENKHIPLNYLEAVNDVREYYMNASVIDPNTIDMTIYKPQESELYNQLQSSGFSYSFISNNLRNYKYNFSYLAHSSR